MSRESTPPVENVSDEEGTPVIERHRRVKVLRFSPSPSPAEEESVNPPIQDAHNGMSDEEPPAFVPTDRSHSQEEVLPVSNQEESIPLEHRYKDSEVIARHENQFQALHHTLHMTNPMAFIQPNPPEVVAQPKPPPAMSFYQAETAVILAQPQPQPSLYHKGNQMQLQSLPYTQREAPDASSEETEDEEPAERHERIMKRIEDKLLEDEPPVSASMCCDGIQFCCQSVDCSRCLPDCCCCCSDNTHLKDNMTSNLRKARNKGWQFFAVIVFALFEDHNLVRDIWVTLELLTVILGLSLSIATFSIEHNGIFNIIHLSLSCVAACLGFIDAFNVLKHCRSCRALCGKKGVNYHGFASTLCCYSCCKKMWDLFRTILSEILIYPLLICSMFNLAIGRSYEGRTHVDRFGFALLVLSCTSLILYNYIIRLLALVGIVKAVTEETDRLNEENASSCFSATFYQIYFVVHVFLQMVVQMLMIIAIGNTIWYENNNYLTFVENGTNVTLYDNVTVGPTIFDNESSINSTVITDPVIYASSFLRYMIVVGYIFPFLGFLSFFMVTYYWFELFPIRLYLDMVGIWQQSTSREDVLSIQNNFARKKGMVQGIFDEAAITEGEFEEIADVSFCTKFLYPFKSPLIVILCIGYTLVQINFFFVYSIDTVFGDFGTATHRAHLDEGWSTFYFASSIIMVIANLYVFLVALPWIVLIYIIILLLPLVICCGLLICCGLGSSDSDS